MKKLFTLAATILLLTGCSNAKTYNSQVTDASEAVASVGNATITKQDIYECLMDASGVDYVLNEVLTQIASTAELDEDEINAEVSSTETTWKAILGDDLDSYTQSYFGYDTFEEYKEAILVPSVRQMIMIDNYSVDHYEELANKYMFVKCRLIIMDDQSSALSVISEINNGDISFEDAVQTYSTDSTNISSNGEIGLVSDLSSCTADENIVAILPQLTIEAIYSVPVELSTGSYGILEIVETDKEVLKDEILAELQESEEVIYEAEAYYLQENGFTIQDEYFKAQMQAQYPTYIN